MAYERDVKEIAYTLDPPAWVSYSGKPRYFKAAMDERRNKTLAEAQKTVDRLKNRQRWQAEDQGVGITHYEACHGLDENYGG